MNLQDLSNKLSEQSGRIETRLERIEDKIDTKMSQDEVELISDPLEKSIKEIKIKVNSLESFTSKVKGAVALLSAVWVFAFSWLGLKE